MKNITLFLTPAPGEKPQFLAKALPRSNELPLDASLPDQILLDSYTREAWAVTVDDRRWKTSYVISVDGKGKIPGFVKYLTERKKAAVGRFPVKTANGTKKRGIFVVSHHQKPFRTPDDPKKKAVTLYCKYILDDSLLSTTTTAPRNEGTTRPQPAAAAAAVSLRDDGKKKRGFLGNILGAQRRTDDRLSVFAPARGNAKPRQQEEQQQSPSPPSETDPDPSSPTSSSSTLPPTGNGVIAHFRNEMEEALTDFQNDPTATVKRLPLRLSPFIKHLPQEERSKVTMDVLSYIVFEQAEEIGEDDGWVTHKERGEFMDEVVIVVYKEGHAPQNVMDEMDQVELPEEELEKERALKYAMAQAAAKQQKESLNDEMMHKKALASHEGNMERLNANKRDRRTVAEIQNDLQKKRSRYDE